MHELRAPDCMLNFDSNALHVATCQQVFLDAIEVHECLFNLDAHMHFNRTLVFFFGKLKGKMIATLDLIPL